MVARTIFNSEHTVFRRSVARFMKENVIPHDQKWQEQGYVDKEVWQLAGKMGFLCVGVPQRFGGNEADKRYSMILIEEQAKANITSLGFGVHSDITAPYIVHYGSESLKEKYLPSMVTGRTIAAIGMTEPSTGSDLQSIKTTAKLESEHYILNGSKTFITNGWNCDLAIVVAKTDLSKRAKGTSLFVVDTGMKGFSKGLRLKKIGLKGQDTAELFFDNVKVPKDNLLGLENDGFIYLMQELPWERLQIAIGAVAKCEAAISWTTDYIKERIAFGKPIGQFQTARFKMAELATETQIARVFVDRCMEMVLEDKLDAATASMAKYWTTDLECKVVDECLQLHGGYGFMWEYPISRAYVDARVQRIYGGTNEIMKELISRSIGLSGQN